ncbi:hypothetical protein GGR54DRAFT_267848 [Hypoxylon sp. NC1633]|nr:hypothetical protein GGR54DRAFT_267848 [Hypoxylon sp. NC1633]
MQNSHDSDGQLEDRLRSLIISNNNQEAVRPLQSPVPSTQAGNGQSEDHVTPRERWQKSSNPSTPAQTPSKASKKRLNQAQRREMQAQLSIPIDTRAAAPNDARQYTSQHKHGSQRSGRPDGNPSGFNPHSSTYQGGFEDHAATAGNLPFPHQRPNQGGFSQTPTSSSNIEPSWGLYQFQTFDSFSLELNVVSVDEFPSRGLRSSHHALYNSTGQRQFVYSDDQLANQSELLNNLCHSIIAAAEIGHGEIVEKESFRVQVEAICRDVITRYETEVNGILGFQPNTVQLKCFGSLSSGYATKAADMDLGLLSPMSRSSPDSSASPIPRLIEKALLERGFGARLLTKTRVPIIKLCEKPNEQLRSGLLESRAKWEKGLADDSQAVAEDVIDEQDALESAAPTINTTEVEDLVQSNQSGDSQQASGTTGKAYKKQITSLKQYANQSLMAYYGHARRLLRQLNGCDVNASNRAGFKPLDYRILNDVCGAFINGLNDKSLRKRVNLYPSVQTDTMSKAPNFRSLLGVLTMVEGEQLVVLLETRTATGDNSKPKPTSNAAVRAWKNLQNTRSFGTDPFSFNRELKAALARLRQIPLIQLIQLKQDQRESPTQYYPRVLRVMTDIHNADPSSKATLLPEVTQHYISGIRDDSERDKVQAFASSTEVKSLNLIARKHKAVHLEAHYRRAIARRLYGEEDLPIIEAYIKILQEDFEQLLPHADGRLVGSSDLAPPANSAVTTLVRKIKQLADPSRLIPNQPRDRPQDYLEFPKNGVGVQCDINFSADLALQNTLLLRCYSYTDPRVRPMVLFVKHWAKVRGINTPYRGTLSSYGYVLMVLHYLVNIAEPFVCPNLQQLAPPDPNLPAEALEGLTTCRGHDVRFWRDEQEIKRLADLDQLNQNRESLGFLLRGFFEYYAQTNFIMSTTSKSGFDWLRDVLSLRTPGGLLSKQEKGWIGAKTVVLPETGALPNPSNVRVNGGLKPFEGINEQHAMNQVRPSQVSSPDQTSALPVGQTANPKDFKEVRNRFLFAIEDPFETEHNVARTVTHMGVVSIRDEFRRAWRIIREAGKGGHTTEDLLEDIAVETERVEKQQFAKLLEEIHGRGIFDE